MNTITVKGKYLDNLGKLYGCKRWLFEPRFLFRKRLIRYLEKWNHYGII